MSILENGRETFDQTPVAYPLHFDRPEPLHLRIRRMILEQMAESMSYEDVDTAEEADDFSVPDDDIMPSSPYEMEDDFDNINNPNIWKGGAGGGTTPEMESASKEGFPPVSEKASNNETE